MGQQFTDIFIQISKHCWAIFFGYITHFLTVKVAAKSSADRVFSRQVCLFFFWFSAWSVRCVWAIFCDVFVSFLFSAHALIPRTRLKGEASKTILSGSVMRVSWTVNLITCTNSMRSEKRRVS